MLSCSYYNFLPEDTQTSREQISALGDMTFSSNMTAVAWTTKEQRKTLLSNASKMLMWLESPWDLVKMQTQVE